jgi:hypothetical protein
VWLDYSGASILRIRYVFAAFAAVALVGGLVTLLFAIETRGQVLEDLSRWCKTVSHRSAAAIPARAAFWPLGRNDQPGPGILLASSTARRAMVRLQ